MGQSRKSANTLPLSEAIKRAAEDIITHAHYMPKQARQFDIAVDEQNREAEAFRLVNAVAKEDANSPRAAQLENDIATLAQMSPLQVGGLLKTIRNTPAPDLVGNRDSAFDQLESAIIPNLPAHLPKSSGHQHKGHKK